MLDEFFNRAAYNGYLFRVAVHRNIGCLEFKAYLFLIRKLVVLYHVIQCMKIVFINSEFLFKDLGGSLTFNVIVALTTEQNHCYDSGYHHSENSCKHLIP